MEVAGPLGTPLGLAQRKRASPRGDAGTSGFLCVSDSDRRVPAELGMTRHSHFAGLRVFLKMVKSYLGIRMFWSLLGGSEIKYSVEHRIWVESVLANI